MTNTYLPMYYRKVLIQTRLIMYVSFDFFFLLDKPFYLLSVQTRKENLSKYGSEQHYLFSLQLSLTV